MRRRTASFRPGSMEEIVRSVQQEIILGIGGVRALRALGQDPMVWHLNEGHAAFVALERIRELVERGESFEAALQQVQSSTVFTTHTPVAAGHDAYPLGRSEERRVGKECRCRW